MEDLATTASSNLTSPRVNLTFEPINPQQNVAEGGVFESIKNSLQSLRVIAPITIIIIIIIIIMMMMMMMIR